MLLPRLDLVDPLHGVQVYRIDGKPVKSVGRQGDNVAFAQTGDDVVDPVGLGFIGMDAQNLRGQEAYLGSLYGIHARFPGRSYRVITSELQMS